LSTPAPPKEWLLRTLLGMHPKQYASLLVLDDGDHCRTSHGAEVRTDGEVFFRRVLDAPDPSELTA
jgi:hypothetical protein